jgi:hypothetical protein
MTWKRRTVFFLTTLSLAALAAGQGLPASQPDVLLISIEEVKLGHAEAHLMNEKGWPAAYERANSAYPYIALASMTGTSVVWYVSPYTSHSAMAESFAADSANEELSAEIARLYRADAEHVNSMRTVHLVGRKDLSHGAYPDTAKQRFYEITRFRVRPGGEAAFEAAAKAYGAAAMRAAPNTAYRVYEVVAGLPAPTFFIFGSVTSFGALDAVATDMVATFKAMNPQEQEAMSKFTAVLVESETHRYRLDPDMSYVPKAVRDTDPGFWKKK